MSSINDTDTLALTEAGSLGVADSNTGTVGTGATLGTIGADTGTVTPAAAIVVAIVGTDGISQSETPRIGPATSDSLTVGEGIDRELTDTDGVALGDLSTLSVGVVETIAASEAWTKNGYEPITYLEIPSIQVSLVAPETLLLADPMIYADVNRPGDLKGSGVFSISGHTPQPSQLTWIPMPEVGTFLSGKPLRQGRPGLTATWPMLSYDAMAVLTSLWSLGGTGGGGPFAIGGNPFVTLQVPDPRSGRIVQYRAVMNRPVFQSRSTVYFMNVTCTFDWLTPLTTTAGHPTAPNYP